MFTTWDFVYFLAADVSLPGPYGFCNTFMFQNSEILNHKTCPKPLCCGNNTFRRLSGMKRAPLPSPSYLYAMEKSYSTSSAVTTNLFEYVLCSATHCPSHVMSRMSFLPLSS